MITNGRRIFRFTIALLFLLLNVHSALTASIRQQDPAPSSYSGPNSSEVESDTYLSAESSEDEVLTQVRNDDRVGAREFSDAPPRKRVRFNSHLYTRFIPNCLTKLTWETQNETLRSGLNAQRIFERALFDLLQEDDERGWSLRESDIHLRRMASEFLQREFCTKSDPKLLSDIEQVLATFDTNNTHRFITTSFLKAHLKSISSLDQKIRRHFSQLHNNFTMTVLESYLEKKGLWSDGLARLVQETMASHDDKKSLPHVIVHMFNSALRMVDDESSSSDPPPPLGMVHSVAGQFIDAVERRIRQTIGDMVMERANLDLVSRTKDAGVFVNLTASKLTSNIPVDLSEVIIDLMEYMKATIVNEAQNPSLFSGVDLVGYFNHFHSDLIRRVFALFNETATDTIITSMMTEISSAIDLKRDLTALEQGISSIKRHLGDSDINGQFEEVVELIHLLGVKCGMSVISEAVLQDKNRHWESTDPIETSISFRNVKTGHLVVFMSRVFTYILMSWWY